MQLKSALVGKWLVSAAVLALLSPLFFTQVFFAQAPAAKNRIVQGIDDFNVRGMSGTVHPRALPRFDQGRVESSLRLERVTLFFKPSVDQQRSLDTLLRQQQDPASPNYRKWLTPERYAAQFGLSPSDFDQVAGWLKAKGFTVVEAPPSRSYVAFNGSAVQVESALHTEMHHYLVSGKMHYANANEPSLPAAFAGIVGGVRGLHDFRPRPRSVARKVHSNFTSSLSGSHFVAPDDFATIYNLQKLYQAGLDGTGQTIAVAGQTDILLSDIDTFRSVSGLAPNDPQVILVPGSADPGVVNGDIGEADLDIEWSGAVARNATILYVNSKNAFDSLSYAVAHNLAPVISISYGDCEQHFSQSEIDMLTAIGQQAATQGQTITAAAGDSGAADCDFSVNSNVPLTSASHGLAVDMPASVPQVTGVGGSRFNDVAASYWNASNNAGNGSAISYIPEVAWNDTAADIQAGHGLAASGGGMSILYSKPTWQTGTGVPNDGRRDVPDIAFSASADHDGYLVCSQGNCVNGYRDANNNLFVSGGTSAGAPTFAGIVALINQRSATSQGNVNPTLYSLAASTPAAFHDIATGDNKIPCASGTKDCVTSQTAGLIPARISSLGAWMAGGFGLVAGLLLGLRTRQNTGKGRPWVLARWGSLFAFVFVSVIVACGGGGSKTPTPTPTPTPAPTPAATMGSLGYNAGVGYDLATGLGSVDAYQLVTAWPPQGFFVSANAGSLSIIHGNSATDTLTVTSLAGFSGNVSFACTVPPGLTGTTCSLSPTSVATAGTATLTVTTSNSTPAGNGTITVAATSGALTADIAIALTVN